jgi:L-cysteine:1D-myo-inositol 2-amino-2-deoxy-alpha-D-glucopyranoside ligase
MLPIANERGNVPQDPNKRDPLDFVLWQAHAPGEPAWDSPWGPGRPGWHIECSTLSTKYLGDMVDIHGGGADLTFPHHECEIAQVEPLTKKPFVRFWFHTAMVSYDGNKMSKSLGNLVMVENLLRVHRPDALRVLLAQNHYREPWSYKEDNLMKAEKTVEKLVKAVTAPGGEGANLESEPYWAAFTADMDNDLDTPSALKGLEDMAEQILDASLARRDLKEAQEALRNFASVFGLRLDKADAEARVVDEWNDFIRRET